MVYGKTTDINNNDNSTYRNEMSRMIGMRARSHNYDNITVLP